LSAKIILLLLNPTTFAGDPFYVVPALLFSILHKKAAIFLSFANELGYLSLSQSFFSSIY